MDRGLDTSAATRTSRERRNVAAAPSSFLRSTCTPASITHSHGNQTRTCPSSNHILFSLQHDDVCLLLLLRRRPLAAGVFLTISTRSCAPPPAGFQLHLPSFFQYPAYCSGERERELVCCVVAWLGLAWHGDGRNARLPVALHSAPSAITQCNQSIKS